MKPFTYFPPASTADITTKLQAAPAGSRLEVRVRFDDPDKEKEMEALLSDCHMYLRVVPPSASSAMDVSAPSCEGDTNDSHNCPGSPGCP